MLRLVLMSLNNWVDNFGLVTRKIYCVVWSLRVREYCSRLICSNANSYTLIYGKSTNKYRCNNCFRVQTCSRCIMYRIVPNGIFTIFLGHSTRFQSDNRREFNAGRWRVSVFSKTVCQIAPNNALGSRLRWRYDV